MKKFFIFTVVLSFMPIFVNGQGSHGLGGQGRHGLGGESHGLGGQGRRGLDALLSFKQAPPKEQTKEETSQSVKMFHDKKAEKNIYFQQNTIDTKDSAFYSKIVKKHGWWIGVGKKLTQKEASHLNCYYKLSKKNNAGNWTYIEAFDGYGKPTTYHNIGTYLANPYDEEDKGLNGKLQGPTLKNDWRENLKSVCKWETIADASGKEVVQERALNANGDVVYIYKPVKVGEREYSGCFTDSWGMPIYMRTDSLGNDVGYANFVHITRDERGFEVLFSYTDRFGFPQKNKDGAYMTRREYDDAGNQIKEASLNIVGDYMIDDYGNCGWESSYNGNNWPISAKYYNADWKPMRMPNIRGGSGKVYGFLFDQDEFGRDTTITVIDGNGNPDVNEFGVHRIVKHYNDHGYQTFYANYDINGNLIAGDTLGIAQSIYGYNEKGLIEFIEYKDAKGQYVNGKGGFCTSVYEYDSEFINISQKDYKINSKDELIIVFDYTRDKKGNSIKKWPLDNQQRIDSVDSKGRNILMAWYDLQGNPIEFEGLHKNITEYDDKNGRETEIWLDKDEDEFVDDERGYSKDCRTIDTINNTLTNYQYYYGLLKQSFQKQFTPDFENIIAQWDITPYGEHARVGWWNNLHYTCKVDYTMYGKIRTMVGRNEFDEPSYLTFLGNSGEVYYFSDINNGHRRYYDEYGVEIPDSTMEEFKDSLPKVFCIEVTDTTIAYPLGLRNGDIIISYGDWITNEDLKTDVDYFYLETILKAKQAKNITLLRHHPEHNSSEIVLLNLPVGRTSDLGFYPHKIYYTKKEKERLKTTSSKYGFTFYQDSIQKDSTILMAVQIKGGLEATRLYHLSQYNVKDPGIVLYAKEEYSKGIDTWSMYDSIEKWDEQYMFRIKGSNLYITQDLEDVRLIDKQSSGLAGMKFIPLNVSSEIYNLLEYSYKSIGDSITGSIEQEQSANSPVASIKKKQIVGKWKMDDSEDNINYSINLDLIKNGKANISFNGFMESEIQAGMMFIFEFSIILPPAKWTLQENILSFDFEDAKPKFTINKIDITGIGEDDKNEMMEQLQNMIEQSKDEIIEDMPSSNLLEDGNLIIKSISEKEFYVSDGKKPFVRKKK